MYSRTNVFIDTIVQPPPAKAARPHRVGLDADVGTSFCHAEADAIRSKVVRHAWQVNFQITEAAVPRKLFTAILKRIQRLRRAENGVVLSR
jgi:hypothetical protein